MTTYEHWQWQEDDNRIGWLCLNVANRSHNTLDGNVIMELQTILRALSKESLLGLVIYSNKASGFSPGADIGQFQQWQNSDEIKTLLELGQHTFDLLSQYPLPTVALLHGQCLGGGLELALACRYRIAEENTRLGLPEVRLGIQPGWGGSYRLIAQLGPLTALPLLIRGNSLAANKAKTIGLVDAVVPERQWRASAIYFVRHLPRIKRKNTWQFWLNFPWWRPLIGKYFLRQTARVVRKKHYPAPFTIINNWIEQGIGIPQDSQVAEIKSIQKLALDPSAKHLVRVFQLREQLTQLTQNKQARILHLHIVGAGVMGAEIAAWSLLQGLRVSLADQDLTRLSAALVRIRQLIQSKLKISHQLEAAMARLSLDPQQYALPIAEAILEVVSENREIKHVVWQKIMAHAKSDALLLTNTSSIPFEVLWQADERLRSRLIGLHFFNPVMKLPLVEIASFPQISQDVIEQALALVGQLKKIPILVTATPGFLVNRVLVPYLLETVQLMSEGILPRTIDQAMEIFGMSLGPVALADSVGLDICLAVAKELIPDQIPAQLIALVNAGKLGRKTNQGFYHYRNGKALQARNLVQDDDLDWQTISKRLLLRMLNEGAACLRENVVANPDWLDAAMIFGTGFAPFRGGLWQVARELGYREVISQLQTHQEKYGDRFKPDAYWFSLTDSNY